MSDGTEKKKREKCIVHGCRGGVSTAEPESGCGDEGGTGLGKGVERDENPSSTGSRLNSVLDDIGEGGGVWSGNDLVTW